MNNRIKNIQSKIRLNCSSKKGFINYNEFVNKKIIDIMDKRIWDLPIVEKDADLFECFNNIKW